jgi:hypothetical protein
MRTLLPETQDDPQMKALREVRALRDEVQVRMTAIELRLAQLEADVQRLVKAEFWR